MLVKRIASICFAVAFLMAIVLFANVGTKFIPIPIARIIFMVAGACGLVLNLFSFQSNKRNPVFTLVYWLGSLILFTGLIFQLQHWPYHKIIVLVGLGMTGLSFFLSPTLLTGEPDNSDILDDNKNLN
jgi:hypothetical protein